VLNEIPHHEDVLREWRYSFMHSYHRAGRFTHGERDPLFVGQEDG